MKYLIYKDECPECPTEPKGEVIRQIFSRYDFCSKNCGILLHIPSWREPEKKFRQFIGKLAMEKNKR